MGKKVALCTCLYNRSEYFKEYLWSVANQTFKDFTLYIWDDGSEEDVKSIIDSYKDKIDIVVKYAEPIHVIGTVKNYVVNLALKDNPTYIQMSDCDDLLEENMLERMVEEMDKTGVDFAICDGVTFGDDGVKSIQNDLNDEMGSETTAKLVERENPFFSWAIFKADVLREQNYEVGVKHFEDWSLYIRLFRSKRKYSIVREELYNYRTHNEQFHKITEKDFEKHRRNMWEINNITTD
jgi:glycosyltransferase involved in cell wall biosynthesis